MRLCRIPTELKRLDVAFGTSFAPLTSAIAYLAGRPLTQPEFQICNFGRFAGLRNKGYVQVRYVNDLFNY